MNGSHVHDREQEDEGNAKALADLVVGLGEDRRHGHFQGNVNSHDDASDP